MKQRRIIKNQIIKAWHQCIKAQRINSERSLQASFLSQLNKLIAKTKRLFIEPKVAIKLNGKIENFFPDLVVCNTREVIAIIELKYQPRVSPHFKKDIEKFAKLTKYRKKLIVNNERFRGRLIDSKNYTFSKNILFVWAGVHKKSNSEILLPKELLGSFVELHAETVLSENPKVTYKNK